MGDEAFTVAVSVNQEEVLQRNLLLSPGLLDGGRNQLLVKRGYPSASLAYNASIDEADNDIVIFVHQDRGGPHPLDRFSSQLRWNPVHDSSGFVCWLSSSPSVSVRLLRRLVVERRVGRRRS